MGKILQSQIQSFLTTFKSDKRWRIVFFARLSLLINSIYALYNASLGILYHLSWPITMCFYYFILSLMRYICVRAEMKMHTSDGIERRTAELKLMHINGGIICLLLLAVIGTAILIIKDRHIVTYHQIVMITIALYTFIKIFMAIFNVIRIQKQNSPLLITIRNISLANAAISILPMQTSMIGTFGGITSSEINTMTMLVGFIISVILLWLGISMIVKK